MEYFNADQARQMSADNYSANELDNVYNDIYMTAMRHGRTLYYDTLNDEEEIKITKDFLVGKGFHVDVRQPYDSDYPRTIVVWW